MEETKKNEFVKKSHVIDEIADLGDFLHMKQNWAQKELLRLIILLERRIEELE